MSGPEILNRVERGIYSSHISERGSCYITIMLALLSLTLDVMFNYSLFKVTPVAVRVVKRQLNVLFNNNWEINGSWAKHC